MGLQYLAASMGYLLMSLDVNAAEKREFHCYLCEFSEQVLEDMLKRQVTQQEAFGIRRPGQS